jgi:PAS domain S-box-containing protein
MKLKKESLKEPARTHRSAEEALKISELRYRRLFEAAQDGILILNAKTGQIDDANPYLAKMLGYTHEQLVGHKLWDIVPHKDIQRTKAEFKDLQRESYVRYEDVPLKTKDGRAINVEFVSNVYRVNGDHVVQCNIRDITRRRLAQEKLKEYSDKLQVLSRRLVEAQEAERRHIARELHDEIGQALVLMQFNLQAMAQLPGGDALKPRLDQTLAVIDQLMEQVQDISLNLRPSMLDDLGLEPALRWYTDRQAASAGLKMTFDVEPFERRLEPMIETSCFRIAQEALTNVVRHAQAKAVTVKLEIRGSELHLRVRDNGTGFDVPRLREKALRGQSLGLLSMEERAVLAGGQLQIKSTPGKGTEVHASFPLKWQTQTLRSKAA